MAISKQESQQIKQQLLKQLENLPKENREQLKSHILGLNEAQLEQFLKQNNIQASNKEESQEPIFAQIVQGKIPSYKIAENDKALAILELNPLSKGHSIVIPKKQSSTEKISKSSFSLAQKIAKKIKSKLKAEDIRIETSSFQDYPIINIIPLYKDQKLEKKQAKEEELIKLKGKLETKSRSKRPQIKQKTSNLREIGFRIP